MRQAPTPQTPPTSGGPTSGPLAWAALYEDTGDGTLYLHVPGWAKVWRVEHLGEAPLPPGVASSFVEDAQDAIDGLDPASAIENGAASVPFSQAEHLLHSLCRIATYTPGGGQLVRAQPGVAGRRYLGLPADYQYEADGDLSTAPELEQRGTEEPLAAQTARRRASQCAAVAHTFAAAHRSEAVALDRLGATGDVLAASLGEAHARLAARFAVLDEAGATGPDPLATFRHVLAGVFTRTQTDHRHARQTITHAAVWERHHEAATPPVTARTEAVAAVYAQGVAEVGVLAMAARMFVSLDGDSWAAVL